MDSAGNLYIAEHGNSRIRKVGTDGVITTVAGSDEYQESGGDGGPATDAWIGFPSEVAVDRLGNLYIVQWDDHYIGYNYSSIIRRVGSDGIISTVAGNGQPGYSGDGGPAIQAGLSYSYGPVLDPSGRMVVADTHNEVLRAIAPPYDLVKATDPFIPSENGAQLFHFDASGRHLETLDALTNAVLYAFTYDPQGRLEAVRDRDGRTTRIDRDADGLPRAIVSPDGVTTGLETDSDGYLSAIVDPAGGRLELEYASSGLLRTFRAPRGGASTMTYDETGLLVADRDAAGAEQTLTRSAAEADRREVVHRSAEGWETVYRQETRSGGMETVRQVVAPTGTRITATASSDGVREVLETADGSTLIRELGPEPRFSMLAPLTRAFTTSTPSGLTASATFDRIVVLSDPDDFASLSSQEDLRVVNGRTYRQTFDRDAGLIERISPEGRLRTLWQDEQGRLLETQEDPRLEPARYRYDAQGRLLERRHGDQAWTWTYDEAGWVSGRSDAAGIRIGYDRDAAGRVVRTTLPSGAVYDFAYDANGNRTSVTMPGGAVHELGYTAVDLEASYTPPGGAVRQTAFNLDRQKTRLLLAGGTSVDYAYEGGERLSTLQYAGTRIDFHYADASPRPSAVVRTEGGKTAHALRFTWDGSLLTGARHEGTAQAGYTYRYDNDFFLVGMTLEGRVETALPRDDDGLPVGYGPFAIGRGGPAGAPDSLSDGRFSRDYRYDELGRYAGGTHGVAGVPFYALSLGYDLSGRLAARTETVAGSAQQETFVYDPDGQLLELWRDGTLAERYTYDVNGNRTGRQLEDGSVEAASYDDQDRLVVRGEVAYTFDADGFMTSRGADTFTYSPRGELLRAVSSGGAVVYRYDGLSRRVEREDAAGVTTYLYGNPTQPFQVTASREPDGGWTVYDYDEASRLFALERGGAWFYVASDPVGSPRVVVDTTGRVVKRIDRDAFGAVLWDSAPAFALDIGYAGGVYDDATGLVRFGLRDYEPAAGRWTARDPLLFAGAQGNLYAYVGNSPLLLRDPFGLFCIGGSYYEGWGGGGSICFGSGGFSVCGKVGAGLGGGVVVQPLKDAEPTKVFASANGSVSLGAGTVGIGGELNYTRCGFGGELTIHPSVGIGPISVDAEAGVSGQSSGPGIGAFEAHYPIQLDASVGICLGTGPL